MCNNLGTLVEKCSFQIFYSYSFQKQTLFGFGHKKQLNNLHKVELL